MAKAAKISPFRLTSLLRLEKNPNIALQIFRNPNPNSEPQKPCRHSARSYDLIVCKLGRAKKFAEMERILDQMAQETRFAAKEGLLCHVISSYGRARMAGPAIRAFDRIPSFRCRRSIRSFNSLLDALLNCGDVDKIAELCRGLDALDLRPDACTYNILIRSCTDSDRALNLFDEMRRKGIEPTVVTFGTLISALCKSSKLDEAFRLKREMMRVYNVKPNVYIYTSLIKALCKDGKLDEALSLKNEIVGLDSAVYSTVIRSLFRAGRKGEVVGVLEEMKRNGVNPDVVTYNAMIAGFCDGGDFDAAFEAVDEMRKKGVRPDVISYNTIISGLCKEGRWRDAVEVFEDMPRRGCRPDVLSYKMVLEGLCDAGEFGDARLVLDEMVFRGFAPGEGGVGKLVDGLCRGGEWGVGVEMLCQSARVNEGVVDAWETVVSRILKDGEASKAGECVDCLMLG